MMRKRSNIGPNQLTSKSKISHKLETISNGRIPPKSHRTNLESASGRRCETRHILGTEPNWNRVSHGWNFLEFPSDFTRFGRRPRIQQDLVGEALPESMSCHLVTIDSSMNSAVTSLESSDRIHRDLVRKAPPGMDFVAPLGWPFI